MRKIQKSELLCYKCRNKLSLNWSWSIFFFSDATFCDHLCLLIEHPLLQVRGPQDPTIRSVSQSHWAVNSRARRSLPNRQTFIITVDSNRFSWLTVYSFPLAHSSLLLLQWFPDATTTTSSRSISRGASERTTRRIAHSSSPSACPSMTTSPRLWGTSGCRLNPSLPPVLPHLPAARVSLTPPPTATAPTSPTEAPRAAPRGPPAAGPSIRWEATSDVGGNWLFTFYCVQLCLSSSGNARAGVVFGRASGFRSISTSVFPNL